MRSDMFKVIVERPRRSKHNHAQAARRRDDPDGPRQPGMRAGCGRPPSLNENLMPLQRFLRAQIGRPWNKVYSEISAGIDRRNAVQQHVFAHLDDMTATQVERRDGRWVDLKCKNIYFQRMGVLRQPLYVDPRTVLIRPNKQYRSRAVERRVQWATEAAALLCTGSRQAVCCRRHGRRVCLGQAAVVATTNYGEWIKQADLIHGLLHADAAARNSDMQMRTWPRDGAKPSSHARHADLIQVRKRLNLSSEHGLLAARWRGTCGAEQRCTHGDSIVLCCAAAA